MLSTFFVLGITLSLLALDCLLWMVLLRWGLRWAKVTDITARSLLLTLVTVIVAQLAFVLVFAWTAPSPNETMLVILHALLGVVAAALIPVLTIRHRYRVGFWRSVQAWLPTLILVVVHSGVVSFVILPFVYETFVLPQNSMAPTLVGRHRRGVCPTCDSVAYFAAPDQRFPELQPTDMICEKFHVSKTVSDDDRVFGGDRIVALKFLAPRRWDLVVFRVPENPSVKYVKRVVGFPNETVHIAEGAVWINGEKLEPPAEMEGLKYLSEFPDWSPRLAGTKDSPAVLGADEYFMLGDFSIQSNDSRTWIAGAPGRSSYAVPAANLDGVVTHLYWPPSRWRILR